VSKESTTAFKMMGEFVADRTTTGEAKQRREECRSKVGHENKNNWMKRNKKKALNRRELGREGDDEGGGS
jgi:hypothetical protein